MKNPKHQRDHHKNHPARLGTQRAAGQPLRALPPRLEQMSYGVLPGVLSRPQKEVRKIKGGVKTNREGERAGAAQRQAHE